MIQHCKYGLRQGLQFFKESWRPRWTWNHERTLSELWVNCESGLWEWTARVNCESGPWEWIRNKLWENLEIIMFDMSRHESWLWTDCWKHLESQPLAVACLLNLTCHNWFAYWTKSTDELGHVKPLWTSLLSQFICLLNYINPLKSLDMWNQFELHLSQFICLLN